MRTAADIIRILGLMPHPEGGNYCEMFRDPRMAGGRPASTAICFLLQAGERSCFPPRPAGVVALATS